VSPKLLGTSNAVVSSEDGSVSSAAPAPAAALGDVVVLQLSADDYGAVLEGRLSAMLEEKVRRWHLC
jgi:hypothetical protein